MSIQAEENPEDVPVIWLCWREHCVADVLFLSCSFPGFGLRLLLATNDLKGFSSISTQVQGPMLILPAHLVSGLFHFLLTRSLVVFYQISSLSLAASVLPLLPTFTPHPLSPSLTPYPPLAPCFPLFSPLLSHHSLWGVIWGKIKPVCVGPRGVYPADK